MSPTHDYILSNQSGASFRTDLNNALAAIASNNSNSSTPATTYAYQWWADTTTGTLKIRNSSNNDWVELLQLDGTIPLEDGAVGTPALAFRDDLNTGIFSSAADTFNVATAGVERMELGATTIFNEDGADVDFRIEGDTNANLFYVDAGNDRVGIGTSTPSSKFSCEGKLTVNGDANGNTGEFFGDTTSGQSFGILVDAGTTTADYVANFRLSNNDPALFIRGDGHVGIGTITPTNATLEVIEAASVLALKVKMGTSTNQQSSVTLENDGSGNLNLGVFGSGASAFGGLNDGDGFVSATDDLALSSINASGAIKFCIGSSGPTQLVTINHSGHLLVGSATNSMGGRFEVTGDVGFNDTMIGLKRTDDDLSNRTFMSFRDSGGSQIGSIGMPSASAVNFNTSSDYRLKENVTPLSDGITRLKTLKPYRFNWKTDKTTTLDGFLAHEVTAVPEAITGTKDEMQDILYQDRETIPEGKEVGDVKETVPLYQGIDQSKLVPLVVAAVQELIAKVEALESA